MLRFWGIAVCFLFMGLQGLAQSDWGGRVDLSVRKSFSENWYGLLRSSVTSFDDFQDLLGGGFVGGLVGYKFAPQWSARLGYRYVVVSPTGRDLREQRPYAALAYRTALGAYKLSNRTRLEWRLYDFDRDDSVRLRNATVLEAPWALTPLELNPYLENEFFVELREQEFQMNRLGSGVFWRPVDRWKLKLGYRWVYYRAGEGFANRHVLVTGAGYSF